MIHALLVLPLEVARHYNSLGFATDACKSYREFHAYHLSLATDSNGLPLLAKEDERAEEIAI